MNAGGKTMKILLFVRLRISIFALFIILLNCGNTYNDLINPQDKTKICNVTKFCTLYYFDLLNKSESECISNNSKSSLCDKSFLRYQYYLCNTTLGGLTFDNADINCY
jgi:hypothetical protein